MTQQTPYGAADPQAAYAASGYAASIVEGRVGGAQAGWGA